METQGVRFQSSLGGSVKQTDSDDFAFKTLTYGKVTKVNYQYGTVEVRTSRTYAGRIEGDDGKYSVPYPKQFNGYTPEGRPFGQTPLIMVGSTVLLGFVEGKAYDPVILNVYSIPEMNKMLSPNVIESGDITNNDIYKYGSMMFTIFPSLNYSFHNGNGSIVRSFNGKSFLSITSEKDEQEMATDFELGTEYDNLFSSRYGDNSLIEPRQQQAPNILFKHQGLYNKDLKPDNHISTFHVKDDGTIRFSYIDKEKTSRTILELDNQGNQRIKIQKDTLSLDESQDYIEYGIKYDTKQFYINNGSHKFEFTEKGLIVDGSPFTDISNKIDEQIEMINTLDTKINTIDKFTNDLNDTINLEIQKNIDTNKQETEKVNQKTKELDESLNNFMKKDFTETTKTLDGLVTKFNTFVSDVYQRWIEQTFNPFYRSTNEMLIAHDDYISTEKRNQVTRDEETKQLKQRVSQLETTITGKNEQDKTIEQRVSSLESKFNDIDTYISQRKLQDTKDIEQQKTIQNLIDRVTQLENT